MSETREAPPNDFRDPFWRDLIANTEQRVGIPAGSLRAVVEFGERTPNDRVSSAGARTVFQIIPSTRNAVLEKYGVDAYLSPDNAAEAAALLLQEKLQRNGGNLAQAFGEYHGGTNRRNWGPVTQSYINRTMVGFNRIASEGQQQEAPAAAQSRRVAETLQQPANDPTRQMLQAYERGEVTPDEAEAIEEAVRERRIAVPPGFRLLGEVSDEAARRAAQAPQSLLDAYTGDKMNRGERVEFERLVGRGAIKVPEGFQVGKTEFGLVDRAVAAVTGSERETEATRTLPDWATMPELNTMSGRSFLAGLGTMATGPEETSQIVKSQFPGVQVRRDERGNYIIRSSIDGNEYAIKPGFRVSDIPRAAGTALAFTPAGRAMTIPGAVIKSGITQGLIETSQVATGGEFNEEDVALAGALGGAVPAAARVLPNIGPLANAALERLRLRRPAAAAPELPPQGPGGPPPAGAAAAAPEPPPAGPAGPGAAARPPMPGAAAMPEPPPAAPRPSPAGMAPEPPAAPAAAMPEPPPAAPRPAAPAMSADEMEQATRAAGRGGIGSQAAQARLAEAAAPNPETMAAAQRLGIAEHLQPDHVTTSQAFRELSQAVKSIPSSALREQEIKGLQAVAERATRIIDDAGRMPRSDLNATVKTALDDTVTQMEATADKLYNRLRQVIPARTEANADETLQIISERLADLGGKKRNLSKLERSILLKLPPPRVGSNYPGPTYALLDDVRKEVGRAARQQGPFADADTGLAKMLYNALSNDTAAVAERFGARELSDAAKAIVRQRKGIEDDMVALFGRDLSNSLLARMDQGFQGVTKGDVTKLAQFINAVPKELRQQVMASGLASAFNKAARDGSLNFSTYAAWWKGLEQNRQAMTLIMSNLPRESRQQLRDLATVSDGISSALRERITTGRINVIRDQLQPADTLAQRVFQVAQRSAVGAPLEALTTGMGMPGTGLAAGITSALMKTGKSEPLKAADTLLASPEFQSMAKATVEQSVPKMEQAARRMAQSRAFQDFAEKAAAPRELGAATQWIMNATQAAQNLRPEQTQ